MDAREEEVKVYRIGVTGHRLLEHLDPIQESIVQVFAMFRRMFPNGLLVTISPLAEGADQMVAECGLQAGTQLFVPLPMPLPMYQALFRSDEALAEFTRLLSQANEVVELPPQEDNRLAYRAVGRYVVDHCDALIAVWDGQDAQGIGGTGEVVAYARTCTKPIIIIHATNSNHLSGDALEENREVTGAMTFEGFDVS